MNTKNIFSLLFFVLLVINTMAQSLSTNIRLNQIGFLPNSIKYAAVVNTQADSFKVMTKDLSQTVFEGQFLPSIYYSSSEEDVSLADFTLVTHAGEYVVVVEDLGKSYPFKVSADAMIDLTKAGLKYYYYNRASMPITSEFGGVWAREAGHPDNEVVVLPSAATSNRPAGTVISTPGGWYDAGDYNKYIVSSGGTVFTLLSAYETYPEFYDTLNTNIPESDNNIPDILDEALYNIKWMMTMQDEDGGVYNKTTEANFSGFDMPTDVHSTRYVTAKGTAATLDFAAVLAMTSRIMRKFDTELADSALNQAIRAWEWAKANPNVVFTNPGSSGGYPGVNTGEYNDSGFEDEFTWSAAELYITTKDSKYYDEINFDQSFGVLGWPTVQSLALISLLVNQDSLTAVADIGMIREKYITTVSGTKNNVTSSPYRIPGDYYYWSGNNAFANWGMMFMQAFRLTGDASYFNAGISTLDYLLGKNATTYCFVTGFGSKSPMHPHHRISSADGVVNPVPGMLVGGPNSGDANDCGANNYPSTLSAKSYLDSECSYSTNEVAIGVNSGMVFLAGAIQAEYQTYFTDSMPRFFSVSTNSIKLTYRIGIGVELTLEGNTEWELVPSVDWISLSATSGGGNASILVNSNTDNPTEDIRTGKIYVYSQEILTDSILVTQNGKLKSFKIEAEDYLNKSGTQVESTADDGGGENVGYIDVDDWLTYSLDITYPGIYDVTIRHAGYAGDFDVYIDDDFIQNITFPKTADWQVWDSYTTEMILGEGQQIMKLEFNAVGTNLNWYQFDWKSEYNSSKINKSESFRIFPNPANDQLNIEFSADMGDGNLAVLSLEGKILITQTINGISVAKIDVSDLENGLYILKADFNSEVLTSTLIIK
ncbi:MAG: glycoside hydrolase family 9 protein [Bacteroidales bacterium]|nr:glycoside hydrolase family 9 protein [Bacteroidales bacterium]MBN2820928.1 glycoside hydrolase family 9 protein [Bacteroidales bacterium]